MKSTGLIPAREQLLSLYVVTFLAHTGTVYSMRVFGPLLVVSRQGLHFNPPFTHHYSFLALFIIQRPFRVERAAHSKPFRLSGLIEYFSA